MGKLHRLGATKDDEKSERRSRLHKEGLSISEMAKAENVSNEAIRTWLERQGRIKQRDIKYNRKADRSDPKTRGFLRTLINMKKNYPDEKIDVLVLANVFREVMG